MSRPADENIRSECTPPLMIADVSARSRADSNVAISRDLRVSVLDQLHRFFEFRRLKKMPQLNKAIRLIFTDVSGDA